MARVTVGELAQLILRLRGYLDSDPHRALAEARALGGKGKAREPAIFLKATLLIDGGAILRDESALREGISILKRLRNSTPDVAGLEYNIANGIESLVRLHDWSSPDAYVATAHNRRELRRLFHRARTDARDVETRARAWVNLANSLDQGFRWAEAYDCWRTALAIDPKHGVAAFNMATMLKRLTQEYEKHPQNFHKAAVYYARLAKRHAGEIERHAGRAAADKARSIRVNLDSSWKPRPFTKLSDPYARFVAEHRLGLVAALEGVDFRRKRWDDIHVASVSEKLSEVGVPPIFAMVNQLKADFCVARWLAYAADVEATPLDESAHPVPPTPSFIDTLDYARYGTKQSMLILAQRAAIDILDRIAVAANEFFSLGEKPKDVSFRGLWWSGSGWHKGLATEMSTWNRGLIALGDLASDLREGGWLESKSQMRNRGTHRFTVLHDMGTTPSRESPSVDHFDEFEFRDETIATLRIARSAILYFIDAIAWHEQNQPEGLRLPMLAVSHHYVRGES